MTATLIVLLLIAIAVPMWSATREAADAARRHGQLACQRAGVQWLDQSVALVRLGLRRNSRGQLRLLSTYSFDYSVDGLTRQRGTMALLGRELQWITDPSQHARLPGDAG